MNHAQETFKLFLQQNPLFDQVAPEIWNTVFDVSACFERHYAKGQAVVHQGEPCTHVGFVMSGSLAMHQGTESGESLMLELFQEQESFGTALYQVPNAVYPISLTALKHSRVLYVPFSQIRRLLEGSPEFARNLLSFLSSRIFNFKDKLQLLQHKDVRSRIILYFANEYRIHRQTTFPLRYTKAMIAEMIGVARPSLSRELKKMREDGLILLAKDSVTLLDPTRFEF